MKTPEKDQLLSDLFAEPADLAHQTQTHALLLREVRRRRLTALTAKVLAVAACGVLGLSLLLQFRPSSSEPAGTPVVQRRKISPMETIHSSRDTFAYVSGSSTVLTPLEVVRTGGSVERIDDIKLLALFEGQPIALVAVKPGQKRLLFLE